LSSLDVPLFTLTDDIDPDVAWVRRMVFCGSCNRRVGFERAMIARSNSSRHRRKHAVQSKTRPAMQAGFFDRDSASARANYQRP